MRVVHMPVHCIQKMYLGWLTFQYPVTGKRGYCLQSIMFTIIMGFGEARERCLIKKSMKEERYRLLYLMQLIMGRR